MSQLRKLPSALLRLSRIVRSIQIINIRRPDAGDLKYDLFIPRFRKLPHLGRHVRECARRKGHQLRTVGLIAGRGIVGAGYDRTDALVWVRMHGQFEIRRQLNVDREPAGLRWATMQNGNLCPLGID
jgi:hypothetical protein